MSYGVGRRRGLDVVLLWCRPVAIVLIQPLAWEPLYAASTALKRKEREREGERGKEGGRKDRQAGKREAGGKVKMSAPFSFSLEGFIRFLGKGVRAGRGRLALPGQPPLPLGLRLSTRIIHSRQP